MKRFTLILAAVFCLATTAVNAQTYVGDIQGIFHSIPCAFTTNGHPYVYYYTRNSSGINNFSIYQSDFTTHVVDINNVRDFSYLFFNYDDLLGAETTGEDLILSQNLFNADDNFEYIEYNGNWGEATALYIKSTNGSTLWSFNTEEEFRCDSYVFKLDNKYYLLVIETKDDYSEYRYHLYFISQSQGLTEVKTDLPISVFPSIANRSQQITVELGEGNNATEVTVVNSLGQVIKRMPVEEGQRQITIPAQELNSGLNVVNTRTEHGQGSCKIIVR